MRRRPGALRGVARPAGQSRRLALALGGVKTEGPMAPEISLANQRPAKYVFDSQVQLRLSEIRANEAREKAAKEAAKAANKPSASAA